MKAFENSIAGKRSFRKPSAPQVDLVLIVNNHHAFHAPDAMATLQANKFVLIEKPIALKLQDTDCIIAADKAAGFCHDFPCNRDTMVDRVKIYVSN